MKSQNQISMQRLSNLLNRKVVAIDGEIGPAVDFLFHDGLWVVPYIVVKTGNWLTGKKVLITPHVLQRHWTRQDIDSLPVSITKEEVKNAPLLDQHAPVSQKYVHKLTQYFQWPMYWPYGPVGEAIAPGSGISNAEGPEKSLKEKSVEYAEATPIRSFKEVSGYECGCSDGSVGSVEDFMCDMFHIHMLLIKAGPADEKHFLVPVEKVEEIQFDHKRIQLNATRAEVMGSPEVDRDMPVTEQVESSVHESYSLC